MNTTEKEALVIAAGAAFGSGAHPSTMLALQAIEGVALNRPDIISVLDVGSGSGVLAIAAAKSLPHAQVIAGDIAPESATFIAHNAELNGVAARITPVRCDGVQHPLIDEHAPYDVLLANLSAELVQGFLRDFHNLTHPESLLIFSGMQRHQQDNMQESLQQAGFQIITPLVQEHWCAMIARHEPTHTD